MADEYGFRDNVPFKALITSNTPQTIGGGATCYLYSLVYNCTNAGTTWVVKIADASTPTAFTLASITMTLSTAPVTLLNLEAPIPISGGLVISATGTPGSVSLFGNYSTN
jgi:hypothetical protein